MKKITTLLAAAACGLFLMALTSCGGSEEPATPETPDPAASKPAMPENPAEKK